MANWQLETTERMKTLDHATRSRLISRCENCIDARLRFRSNRLKNKLKASLQHG